MTGSLFNKFLVDRVSPLEDINTCVAYQPLSRLICLCLSVRATRSLYCDCRRLLDATSEIGSLPVVMRIVRSVVIL